MDHSDRSQEDHSAENDVGMVLTGSGVHTTLVMSIEESCKHGVTRTWGKAVCAASARTGVWVP